VSRAQATTEVPGEEPEYYYTRLIYTGIGTSERGGPAPYRNRPLADFKCSDLERGEGGFGGGWVTDYPASDCKFIWGVERLTNIKAYREAPHPMSITDPNIFVPLYCRTWTVAVERRRSCPSARISIARWIPACR
jgi:hypothetical protein